MFTTRPELRGTFGMVASTHWLASQSGMSVLERGGNAFDAAVATGFVLQVVEPHLNGPGGETVGIFYAADSDEVRVLCGQGVAPAAATIGRFHELGHELVPGIGVLAACVPGAFGAWLALLRDFGTWRLEDVLELAIGYAESGFPIVPRIREIIERDRELIETWPGSRQLYLPPPEPGSLFRNPALAAAYRRIVEGSRGGSREEEIERARGLFYEGFVAEEIDSFVAAEGGFLTGADLAGWEATFEPAVSLEYGGLLVCKTGTWGTGPAALQQLALLRGYDLGDLSEAELVHLVTECAKLAFADRDALYGDAAEIRLDILLSEEYAAERRALVGEDASGELRPGYGRLPRLVETSSAAGSGEPTLGTVHLDVADRFGNVLSATPSGGWLQSSPVIPSLGWPLGTRAQMLWLEEGLPSSLGPGCAAADHALAGSRSPRRRPAVRRVGDARRRPAGAVGAARLPPPRRPRPRPAGRDRRARVPHRPPDLVVPPAWRRAEVARARVALRRADGRRAPAPRPRGDAAPALVARPGNRGRARAGRAAEGGREPAWDAGLRCRSVASGACRHPTVRGRTPGMTPSRRSSSLLG